MVMMPSKNKKSKPKRLKTPIRTLVGLKRPENMSIPELKKLYANRKHYSEGTTVSPWVREYKQRVQQRGAIQMRMGTKRDRTDPKRIGKPWELSGKKYEAKAAPELQAERRRRKQTEARKQDRTQFRKTEAKKYGTKKR